MKECEEVLFELVSCPVVFLLWPILEKELQFWSVYCINCV